VNADWVAVSPPHIRTLAMQDDQHKVPYISKDALAYVTREHAAWSKRQQHAALNLRMRDPGKLSANAKRVRWCFEAHAVGKQVRHDSW
jgi:hypothetical protein